ncbi:hypothetical protein VTK56DRAFT_4756 [Thermocarpiscus australiensis]
MNRNEKRTLEQPKRRACDECRARKLGCSKDIDGCVRCKREGIECVYSPQKRMGRPRKPRPVPVEESETLPETRSEGALKESKDGPVAAVLPEFEFDSSIGMDLDLSFLDMSNPDMNFLEMIGFNNESSDAPVLAATDQGTSAYAKPLAGESAGPGCFWSSQLGEINFDAPLSAPAPPPQATEVTSDEVAHILSADLAETLPSLSPPSSSTPSTHSSLLEQESARTCGCLTALYLALDSLQTLPQEVGEAMRVARTAAKTAHDTILCPVCGDPPLELSAGKTSVISLQSMLMLGALLPSLSNAYMRILGMVDAHAAAADVERRKIRFTLDRYGGLWGWMAQRDKVKCGVAERLEGAELEPILWRLTVRALLKMDVYGVNSLTAGIDNTEGVRQPGLKDIINMMEERSRRRHQMIDDMIASGAMKIPSCGYVPLSSASDKPTCLRIIDIAKRSMDDLIIP